jgi:hypothetical protein
MEKCSVCGREFSRVVNKNMHEKYCKGIKKEEKIIKKSSNNKTNNNTNTNNNKCEHDFILLNEKIENQRQAMVRGYDAYCKKCSELI